MHRAKANHLRQRHGSDAARLDRFERDNNSPRDEELFLADSSGAPSGQQTPKLESGTAKSSYFSNSSLDTKSSQQQHTSQLQSQLSPIDQRGLLPTGAHTPIDSVTTNGLPVQVYHPAAPTWSNMPKKGQLAILAASRFVDFFQMAALQTYMVHQLKSFDASLPDSTISHQSGVLQGAFTASQIITSILWGRAADQPGVGRKLVLNIGLVGTGITCIGVGFSSSYHQAVVWRMLGGAINGTVGAARTMVAETVDKKWHPRAFLLLPAAFNVANVAGPLLGGLLVQPVTAYPTWFGPGSTFGGVEGVKWMQAYPFAIANCLSTVLLWLEALLCVYFLDETLKGFRQVDYSFFNPIRLAKGLWVRVQEARQKGARLLGETALSRRGLLSDREGDSVELDRIQVNFNGQAKGQAARPPQVLPFNRIWTSNVLWTLLSIAIFDFHMGAFNLLWLQFLSTSREFVSDDELVNGAAPVNSDRSVFKFSGGLAFPPPLIGRAMAILGFIGIGLQFLLYPYANARFGLMRCFRFSLFLFPLAYFLAPYISLLPSATPSPLPASGFVIWAGISTVLMLQVSARTFALPASIILLNNSSPHPSVLATIHGLGQACSATFRTLGPILAGYWYGMWLERGVVGMAWWFVAAISAVGCVGSFYVRNGSGHEIFLPGEGDDGRDAASAGGGSGGAR